MLYTFWILPGQLCLNNSKSLEFCHAYTVKAKKLNLSHILPLFRTSYVNFLFLIKCFVHNLLQRKEGGVPKEWTFPSDGIHIRRVCYRPELPELPTVWILTFSVALVSRNIYFIALFHDSFPSWAIWQVPGSPNCSPTGFKSQMQEGQNVYNASNKLIYWTKLLRQNGVKQCCCVRLM